MLEFKIMTITETIKLSNVFDPKDSLDSEIIRDTMSMVMCLDNNNLIFQEKKKGEDFFGKIINLTKSLLKANQHYRNYIRVEENILNEHLINSLENPNKNIYLGINPVELNTEIDGVLSQIKASLDTLATIMNPLFEFNLKGWRKIKNKSGMEIINCLDNNLDTILKKKVEPLREFIYINIEWVSYAVYLRDQVNHYGGLKNISEVIFDYNIKQVIPQKITFPNNQEQLVREFLLATIKEMRDFFRTILILSIQAKVGKGLVIVKNPKDEWPPYLWGILETETNDSQSS